ncbi:MAG: ferrous iron transporter B, partial [Verrucomicrobia bacterium]|nr:ferrous iron transporter B [Verrucomicrobiota bacterium]
GEGWGEGAARFTGMASATEMEGVSATVPPPRFYELPGEYAGEVESLAGLLSQAFPDRKPFAHAEALLLLTDAKGPSTMPGSYPAEIQAAVTAAQQRLEAAGADWHTDAIGARYARLTAIYRDTVVEGHPAEETFSDKLDRLVMHKVWGLVIFLGVMALMFQSIFRLAKVPMNLLTEMVDHLGHGVGALMGPGPLNDLLVGGVIAGVGAVVVFLPQILLLFLFISLLEDTGYMARAAFIMDRLMSKVGLHGKCFIPMLSCFACAIPGIMAARTIESQKDRLITILIAPLMTCSARLPVYTLLIAACIPERIVLGVFTLAGLTLLVMYFLGTAVALAMGWLFKKTILKGEVPLLIMELPPYKRPALKQSLRHMWDRAKIFLRQAGTVILGINVVLWFLSNYPQASVKAEFQARRAEAVRAATGISVAATAGKSLDEVMAQVRETLGKTGASTNPAVALLAQWQALDKEEAGERLRRSFAGHLGRLIEPIIAPLGFDWKIGIGIVSSFAAREVFVSTMSLVYNVGSFDQADTATHSLVKVMQDQKRPDGRLVFSARSGLTLMVFYVFALQCASTVVVVRRETNSWRWPLFQWVYLAMLAWSFSFFVYQGGRFLGMD